MKERNDCDALAKRDPGGVYALVLQPLSPPPTTTTVIVTTTTLDQRRLLEDILNCLSIHGSLKGDMEMNVSIFMGHLRVTWK